MKIGIDVRSLQNDSQLRGIGTYTRSLVRSLLELDRKNEYVFFSFKNRPFPEELRKDCFKDVRCAKVTSRRKRFVWLSGQAFIPRFCAREGLDIFYSPEYIVPVFARSKKVITVHDFINNDYAPYWKKASWVRKAYFYLKDGTLKHADKIIAISEYTKRKIIERVGVKGDKIRVIYEGADAHFCPRNDSEKRALCARYGFPADFLLYVGALDHHKNIEGLLRAFSKMRGKKTHLVLAGVKNEEWYFLIIKKLIDDLGLKDRVRILGFVPLDDLVLLYNAAKAFVSVSAYEGFGLPVLEAMSCKTPVIAAGNTSMREVVDSSGILVDPYNFAQIAHAMDTLVFDEAMRSELAEKAIVRARVFSWDKAARQTLDLFTELAEKG